MRNEDFILLHFLKFALSASPAADFDKESTDRKQLCFISDFFKKYSDDMNWTELIHTADRHSVLSLLYDTLTAVNVCAAQCETQNSTPIQNQTGSFIPAHTLQIPQIPQDLMQQVQIKSTQIVLQNYRLLYYSSFLITLLEEAGISVLLLKGWQTAQLYPVPEARKSGDIDLLIPDPAQFEQAVCVLENHGFQKESTQLTHHHTVFTASEHFHIELHAMLSEPFEQNELNTDIAALLPEYNSHRIHKTILGYPICAATDPYDAYYLLLHMLQHFVRAGFGVKLLCDWTVFWKRGLSQDTKEVFLQLLKKTRLENFAKAVTALCVLYLGLPYTQISFLFGNVSEKEALSHNRKHYAALMDEILEAEEFGHSSTNRMVFLKNSSLTGFLCEFHHQMKLGNSHSDCILLWPYLWCTTLIRFLRNNRRIRKTSTLSIFKKASQRSRLLRDLKLFEK